MWKDNFVLFHQNWIRRVAGNSQGSGGRGSARSRRKISLINNKVSEPSNTYNWKLLKIKALTFGFRRTWDLIQFLHNILNAICFAVWLSKNQIIDFLRRSSSKKCQIYPHIFGKYFFFPRFLPYLIQTHVSNLPANDFSRPTFLPTK